MPGYPLSASGQYLPSTQAAAPIVRSWERCASAAADLHDDPIALRRGDLQERLEQHACVLRAAQPEIETLAGMVASASSLVLLADASGVILQATGNTGFLQRADHVALRPGVSWAENHRGTNAIGTALIEAAALRVHGAEHFLRRNQILSCHAAPIRSPRGDILGVLDISGDAGRMHAYALSLASMCARQVSNRVIEQAGERCLYLVFHKQASLLDSVERGLLLIEDERIVGANDAAVALLGATWPALLDQPLDGWLVDWRAVARTPGRVHTPQGAPFHAVLRQGGHARSLPPPRPPRAAPAPAAGEALPALAPALQAGFERARRALDCGLSVLLQGETGAGKEVYAQHLYRHSIWRNGPFVAVNCGALPESLIEAELFGYEPGAYTGARRLGARGRLREADGGVLFLDEIGDMPLALQTRLLRALQERVVQPLGADKAVPVSFGLISATHRDLDAMIAAGEFRADLYYRLHDYAVPLPRLRERDDLRPFICAALRALDDTPAGLTLADDALDALAAYAWPGNYRQLRSVLRTLALFHPPGSLIHRHHLPAAIAAPAVRQADAAAPRPGVATPPAAPASLRDASLQRIDQALAGHGGNIAAAAHELGIHRSTLYRHLARQRA
ncbi:putative acetoin catabolism regulatory protein [Bordetella bronchiseptica MBORD635]|uniref:sigma-54-dependent Fis family transcriptional regulator n=1 Tax=Bordetella bronchiseptica TaxID=518 RepID=UPI0004610C7F|nr:sigma-54-dependent Fis family transcriptional regulator [Bordetella bronchiseptica]KDC74033.1 putative acetoin catabolism regulatory protein [Bordetella bronchiseptica MBORD635]